MNETKFGYEKVSKREKESRVNDVFSSVSGVYDRMNDTMSLGIHHLWKRHAVHSLNCYENAKVMDLACGSGDISELIIKKIPRGNLLCVDPNTSMLKVCQDRLQKHKQVSFIEKSAEKLDFDLSLDRIIVGFGLRNFSDPELGLKNLFKALKIGGKLVILEFNPPNSTALQNPYEIYLNHIIPFLGKIVGQDEASYKYLSDSISVQPQPEERLAQLESAGFEFATHTPLTLGIVGLFEAHKCK